MYSPSTAVAFISALGREAAGYHALFRERLFESVYIGGGTPTVLSPGQLGLVMDAVKRHFPLASDVEYTIEANPNSLSAGHLSLFREQGVSRLSLGVQSFSPDLLKILGRPHTVEQAVDAFSLAREAGMSNIGIDLIYGIPGQREHQWLETVGRALDLAPEHISAYALSLDEGSRFLTDSAAGSLVLPDDESTAVQYESVVSLLNRAGYLRYEVSNFALPGHACRHNLNYWKRGEYLGIGPGAWSFLGNRRYQNIGDVEDYTARLIAGAGIITAEELIDSTQAANEYVMLALRTSRGIDLDRYGKEYGARSLERLETNSERLRGSGLLESREGRLVLTDRGFLLSNEVLTRLFR